MAGVAPVERDRRAVARLLRFYRPDARRWRRATGEAWQLALAVEAVATTYERSHAAAYVNALSRWFARHRHRRSRFYDDDAWYVNAWLRAYDVTGDPAYLAAARAGFADLLPGWDDTCGGGLWWNHDRRYKNAITTELFLLAAARLARRCPAEGEEYLDWASRAWTWFDHSGLSNVDGLVNDGLGPDCRNNGGTTWTYNQGVLLGGLAELWRSTGDPALLARARQVADAATTALADPAGILREPCEPAGNCDRDQQIFKGIFAQGLARLHHAGSTHPGADPGYAEFLTVNADSVWDRARDQRDRFGLSWSGPPGRVTAATHAAGTLLLGQVALLEVGGETTRIRPEHGTDHPPQTVHNGQLFVVPAPARRRYALTFHYRAEQRDAYQRVEVDGVRVADRLLFVAARAPSTVSLDVALGEGDHTVELTGGRAPALERLTLR